MRTPKNFEKIAIEKTTAGFLHTGVGDQLL